MRFFKRFLGVAVTLAIIAVPIVVWFQRQALIDWYRLKDYTPPADVVRLADTTTMTASTRRLFYINRPEIADKDSFNAACSQEASIVLGCYISGRGIYLYHITDSRLTGVMEVTAAHEALHAAYERLSQGDREHVDAMTAAALKDITDQRLLATVEKYRSQDASVVPNELHSILATEVRALPPELEDYYQRYFTNRSAVVALSEQYEGEFSKRQAQVAVFDAKLATTKNEIETAKSQLTTRYEALVAARDQLDSLRSSGDIAAYNNGVPGFNAQVSSYNALVESTDQKITAYNKLVEQRNNLALEVQGLAQAIDSRPQNF